MTKDKKETFRRGEGRFLLVSGPEIWSQGPKRYGVTLRSTTSLPGDQSEPREARREVMTSYFFFVVFLVVFFFAAFFLAMALSPPFSARKCKGGEKQSQCFFHPTTGFFLCAL